MDTAPIRLFFVCTGNICRSPMAAGFARHWAESRGWPIAVRSGGTANLIGRPADPLAVRVMGEVGIDISGHRSAGVRAEDIAWADHILVMEMNHQLELAQRFEGASEKVLQLGTFGGMAAIADPIGGWRWRFRRSRADIGRCVERFMDRLPPPA